MYSKYSEEETFPRRVRGLLQLAELNSCASLCHGVNERFDFMGIFLSAFGSRCVEASGLVSRISSAIPSLS